MPISPDIAEPEERTISRPDLEDNSTDLDNGPYVVILYNDDYHAMDEVMSQLQKATGFPIDRCINIMLEAHTRGRAIAYTGSQNACERVAGILRQIRLQVETDCF